MTRKLTDAWDQFVTMVFTGAPLEQRNDLKVAFFAGATTMFGAMIGINDTTDVDDLAQELKEFAEMSNRIAKAAASGEWTHKVPPVTVGTMRQVEQFARTAFAALDYSCDNVFQRRELGAALFVFSFAGPELTYISNAGRQDMMKMLQDFLAANPPPMTWDEQHG